MSCHCKIGCPRGSAALMDDLSRGSLDLNEDRAVLEQANPPDYLHLDIADGQFVPASVASGSETVKTLREKLPNTFLDVHMMINEPEKRVDEMASAGASQFTFHLEATNNPMAVIEHVRRKGMKVGLGLKPTTPVENALPYAAKVDSVLILTVEPCSVSSRSNQTLTQTDKNSSMQKVHTLQEACPGLDVKTDGWDEASVMQHPTPVTRSKVEDTATPTLLSSPRSTPPATANNSTTADQWLHQNGVPTCSSPKTPLLQAQGGGGGGRGGRRINSNAAVPSYGSLQTYESADDAFRVSDPYDKGGSSYLVVPPKQQSPIGSIRCECHVKVVDKTAKRAKIKLVLASIIALGFMAGEVVGGYFAGSLAIMTDAAHMLSDFAGFLISLFAIWLGSRPSSNRMSFGWHRAEVMGAVVSVLIIWVITGVLFYEAVQRVIHPIKINADIMLITACIGVFVNVFMCMVLHPHSHGHNHGTSGHSNKKKENQLLEDSRNEGKGDVSGSGRKKRRFWQRKNRQHNKHGSEENINVRAAFIHVIGDLIQSIGVVIAGYIIKFKPSWTIVDPICTFIFCILVLISTLNVLKDALRVLMEGTPKHIDYTELKEDLEDVRGVKKAHSLHIWSLTVNKTALAAHLVTEPSANHQAVLNEASQMLKERYNIISTTLQVEDHHDLMEECGTCQETDKAEFCNFTCWPL